MPSGSVADRLQLEKTSYRIRRIVLGVWRDVVSVVSLLAGDLDQSGASGGPGGGEPGSTNPLGGGVDGVRWARRAIEANSGLECR